MATINLTYTIDATAIKELAKEFRKVDSEVKKADDQTVKFKSSLVNVSFALNNIVQAASNVRNLTRSLVGVYDALGDISDNADAAGMSIERFQQWQYVMENSGVQAEQFNMAVGKLNNTIAAAVGGNKQALTQFSALGITMDDLKARSNDVSSVMSLVGERIAEIGDKSQQTAAVADFFGQRNLKLVNIFRMGASAIEEMMVEAQQFGYVLSEDVVRAGDQAGDKLTILWRVIQNQLAVALVAVAPLALSFAQYLQTIIQQAINGEGPLISFANTVIDVANTLGRLMQSVNNVRAAYIDTKLSGSKFLGLDIGGMRDELDGYLKELKSGREQEKRYQEQLDKASSAGAKEYYNKRLEEQRKYLQEVLANANRTSEAMNKLTKEREGISTGEYKPIESITRIPGVAQPTQLPEVQGPAGGRSYLPDMIRQQEAAGEKAYELQKQQQERLMRLFHETQMQKARAIEDDIMQARLAVDAELAEKWRQIQEEFTIIELRKQAEADYAEWKKAKLDELALKEAEIRERQVEEEKNKLERMKRENYGAVDFMMEDWGNFNKNAGYAFAQFGQKVVDGLATMAMTGKVNFKALASDFIMELLRMEMRLAVSQVFNWVKGGLGLKAGQSIFTGLFGSAKGNVFDNGRIVPFARGGFIDNTAIFPLRGNKIGMAGENGREAALPIVRGPGGDLMVGAAGGRGGTNITINISNSTDAGNTAMQVQKAVVQAMRGVATTEVLEQRRVGNALNPVSAMR